MGRGVSRLSEGPKSLTFLLEPADPADRYFLAGPLAIDHERDLEGRQSLGVCTSILPVRTGVVAGEAAAVLIAAPLVDLRELARWLVNKDLLPTHVVAALLRLWLDARLLLRLGLLLLLVLSRALRNSELLLV